MNDDRGAFKALRPKLLCSQEPALAGSFGCGCCGLVYPLTGAHLVPGVGRHILQDVGIQLRFMIDPVVHILQPSIPPFERFLKEANGRPRHAVMWIRMTPGADDSPLGNRYGQVVQESEDRIGPAISLSCDGKNRTLNFFVMTTHGPLQPVGIAPLMSQPGLEKKRRFFQAV